jgi:aldehyde dehydrogenase (NAD+)
MTYTDLNQVIQEINNRPKPLALYIFTQHKKVERELLKRTSSGGVAINDTITHITSPYLPFGGVGSSGMGAYHGKYSFLTFSHQRSVVKKTNMIDTKVLYPPYKNRLKVIRKIMK